MKYAHQGNFLSSSKPFCRTRLLCTEFQIIWYLKFILCLYFHFWGKLVFIILQHVSVDKLADLIWLIELVKDFIQSLLKSTKFLHWLWHAASVPANVPVFSFRNPVPELYSEPWENKAKGIIWLYPDQLSDVMT